MIVALEQELLTPACVERVVQKVLIRAVPTGAALEQARATLSQDLTDVRGEVENLIESLAKVGVSSALTAALKAREMREAELERALAGLERREQVSAIEASRLEATARSKATEWRALLRRHCTAGAADSGEDAAREVGSPTGAAGGSTRLSIYRRRQHPAVADGPSSGVFTSGGVPNGNRA